MYEIRGLSLSFQENTKILTILILNFTSRLYSNYIYTGFQNINRSEVITFLSKELKCKFSDIIIPLHINFNIFQ